MGGGKHKDREKGVRGGGKVRTEIGKRTCGKGGGDLEQRQKKGCGGWGQKRKKTGKGWRGDT